MSWRRHRVEAGETLTSIGKKYHVTPVAIADANNLEHRAALDPGEKLIIPAAARAGGSQAAPGELPRAQGRHPAGNRRSLQRGSGRCEKWNRLKTNHVSRGMVLRIYTLGGAPEARPAGSRSASKKKARTGTSVAQTSTRSANKN